MANHPKIERGIPMPIKSGSWDWMEKLEIGDSFVVPAGKIATIRNAATRRKMKIATRRSKSNEYRVWRIK
tara:strand:+ start:969 stop:1178 length:210 start_codon:yes stop_codon:yes gene_type:complete